MNKMEITYYKKGNTLSFLETMNALYEKKVILVDDGKDIRILKLNEDKTKLIFNFIYSYDETLNIYRKDEGEFDYNKVDICTMMEYSYYEAIETTNWDNVKTNTLCIVSNNKNFKNPKERRFACMRNKQRYFFVSEENSDPEHSVLQIESWKYAKLK